MKFKSTAFVAAAVFAAASPCVTQAAEQSSRKERHGAYLFGDIGSASVQAAALQARVPGGKALKKSTSSALGYGFGVGYRFGDHFALEGGYRGMSGANVPMLPAADGRAQGRKFRTNGLQISALGIIPLGQHFELYGRASLAYMRGAESEEGGGTLTSPPLSRRERGSTGGAYKRFPVPRSSNWNLLPSGEGGGSRMRVRVEQCTSLPRSGRTLTPHPFLPRGLPSGRWKDRGSPAASSAHIARCDRHITATSQSPSNLPHFRHPFWAAFLGAGLKSAGQREGTT